MSSVSYLFDQVRVAPRLSRRTFRSFSRHCSPLLLRAALLLILSLQTTAAAMLGVVWIAASVVLFVLFFLPATVIHRCLLATYERSCLLLSKKPIHISAPARARHVRLIALGLASFLSLCLLPQFFGETTAFSSFAANTIYRNNLHEVVPHTFFRAAQMPPERLAEVIQQHGIKTVIDLRYADDDPDQTGSREEDTVAQQGAAYYHRPLRGSNATQQEAVQDLIRIYDEAQTPILVHCTSGTHRSGVAAAVWLLTKEHADIGSAKEQLSWPFGYFHWERRLKSLIQGHQTIDAVIWEYERTLHMLDISFRDWIRAVRNEALG